MKAVIRNTALAHKALAEGYLRIPHNPLRETMLRTKYVNELLHKFCK